MKRILLAALLLASCSKSGTPDIQISDAWARETVTGQTATAAYLTVVNRGSGDDRLISVEATAPAKAMLHASERSGGISRMREMGAGLALPAGTTVELKPGGYHVMLLDLKAPLAKGASVPLTLVFQDAKGVESKLDLTVPVGTAAPGGATAGTMMNGHKH